MRSPVVVLIAVLVLFANACNVVMADTGDPAGWSVATDPRQRAFLVWTPEPGGPRILMLGCLRDAEMFTTMSADVGERDEFRRATLRLSSGSHEFDVSGSVTHYPHLGRSSFISDLDADRRQMLALGRKLMPVLEGKNDITLTLTPGAAGASSKTRQLPLVGLAPALKIFARVCFK